MKWMHLGEKTCQFNETSPHLGEKTEDMPTQRDKPSTSGCDKEDDNSPRAHHRAGGQAGCGHSNPGNEAIFPD
ncbi:hypothetical protein TNCV_3926161 [Trichonephila clavipes]|nr:hypothetical protein TNCV_3926161 [Trichonephila clavipes]